MTDNSTKPEVPDNYEPYQGRYDFRALTQETKDALRYWSNESNRVGLWVYGPRRSGTSYVAGVASGKAEAEVPDAVWEPATIVRALDLMDNVRKVWTYETLIKQHPDDLGFWEEYSKWSDRLERVWNGPVTWVDDLDQTVDMSFWRRHVQPRLEQRIKQGRFTIIATTHPPDSVALEGLLQVILDLFHIIRCEREPRAAR